MPRTLIYGTSHIGDQTARWTLEQWARLAWKLNPGVDRLLIDTAAGTPLPPLPLSKIFTFPDNIGTLARGGRDGWGRAFVKGLEFAIEGGYDWAVFAECDLLLARPVGPIIERLVQCGVKAACPMANPYVWIETALTFMDVRYMQEIDFIRRYGWETAPAQPWIELRVEELLGDRFMALPLRGIRNDLGTLTPRNMKQMFPGGPPDYLHHCSPSVFRAMLEQHGLSEG